MTAPKAGAILRALGMFAVLVVMPRAILAIGTLLPASWAPLGEFRLLVAMAWKLLIYPHDVAWLGSHYVLPGALAPAVAVLQWAIVGIAVAALVRRRSLGVQLALDTVAIVLVGFAVHFAARSVGVIFQVQ